MSNPREIEDDLLTLDKFGEMGKHLIASWGNVCEDILEYHSGVVKEINPAVLGVFENFQLLLDISDDLSECDLNMTIGPFQALKDLAAGELSDNNLETFNDGRYYILETLIYATRLIEGRNSVNTTLKIVGQFSEDMED